MSIARRTLLSSGLALPFLRRASAQEAPTPILFVHGNGDHAALWMTTLWRFESNAWPRERLMAISLPDPLARADDAVPQPDRSSSAEQTERVAAAIAELRSRTGAAKVALIGNSRGGYPIRDVVSRPEGAAQVSHAITCGTPNHGVYDWEFNAGSEFNGRAPFLRRLNGGASEVTKGVSFLTIRSDNDLYAQPDGRYVGRPGTPTGVTQEGPALRGATNILLPGLDHRETAYHWRAFREQFKHIAGREPLTLSVMPEERPRIGGIVTGLSNGVPTNRPVAGATVEVFTLDWLGQREGDALLSMTTGADGAWGTAVLPAWRYMPVEIVLTVPGHPIAHFFRPHFPRSSSVVNLRPPAAITEAERGAGCLVRLVRPRGYFSWPRDVVLIDNEEVVEKREGVASIASATRSLPAGRAGTAVYALFNEEKLVGRGVPLSENRISVMELTW
ncbi:hydrolase [Roseococcus sp. YIM B11640]|uniref:hydrolase n=1 Tax=Roseococcus sp. YIM B11640 TaxID=3133973 RepID=UPI003C7AF1D3